MNKIYTLVFGILVSSAISTVLALSHWIARGEAIADQIRASLPQVANVAIIKAFPTSA